MKKIISLLLVVACVFSLFATTATTVTAATEYPTVPQSAYAAIWGYVSFASGKTLKNLPYKDRVYCYLAAAGQFMVGDGNVLNEGETITRAEMVQVLYNMAGSKKVSINSPFKDVKDKSYWAYNAIMWAYQAGVVAGKPGGIFDPNGKCTRAELAQFFYAFTKTILGVKISTADITGYKRYLDTYTDRKQIPQWAQDAMAWMVSYLGSNAKVETDQAISSALAASQLYTSTNAMDNLYRGSAMDRVFDYKNGAVKARSGDKINMALPAENAYRYEVAKMCILMMDKYEKQVNHKICGGTDTANNGWVKNQMITYMDGANSGLKRAVVARATKVYNESPTTENKHALDHAKKLKWTYNKNISAQYKWQMEIVSYNLSDLFRVGAAKNYVVYKIGEEPALYNLSFDLSVDSKNFKIMAKP